MRASPWTLATNRTIGGDFPIAIAHLRITIADYLGRCDGRRIGHSNVTITRSYTRGLTSAQQSCCASRAWRHRMRLHPNPITIGIQHCKSASALQSSASKRHRIHLHCLHFSPTTNNIEVARRSTQRQGSTRSNPLNQPASPVLAHSTWRPHNPVCTTKHIHTHETQFNQPFFIHLIQPCAFLSSPLSLPPNHNQNQ